MNVILRLILEILWLYTYTNESFRYNTTGTGNQKVDRKATKAYYKTGLGSQKAEETKRKLEFDVIMLAYLMHEDDGELTTDEKVLIKKHIKPHEVLLERKDLKRFKRLVKETRTMEDIIKYIQLHQITKFDIERVMGLLAIMNQVVGRYGGIIQSIERQLAYHTEFLG